MCKFPATFCDNRLGSQTFAWTVRIAPIFLTIAMQSRGDLSRDQQNFSQL